MSAPTNQHVSTLEMTHDEWVEFRKRGIGGSDVAAILGQSPWRTALDIYNEKLGLDERVITPEQEEAMWYGSADEETIARRYTELTGRKVVRDNKVRIHKQHPYLIANVDRIIIPDNGQGRGILECKSTSGYYRRTWNDVVPLEYFLQMQHYLNVCDMTWGEFAIRVDKKTLIVPVERDQPLIDLMEETLSKFWKDYVLKQIPPPPQNSEDIAKLFPETDPEKVIEAADETAAAVEELRTVKGLIKKFEEQEERLTESLKLAMRDAETLERDGQVLCTWKMSKPSSSFDSKAFGKQHPDLFARFSVTKPGMRRFILK